MDLITRPGSAPVTMSSREIAELCEKEHAHVMRDIRVMLEGLGEGQSKFGSTYPDAQGKDRACYLLPKRETLILVSGYSVTLRARIIDRWQELERQAEFAQFKIPQTYSEALRELADMSEQMEKDRPKVEFFDIYINADGLYNLQNGARALNARPNLFIQWLKQKYLFYQGTALVPRVQYIQQGLFEVKSEIVDDKARYQTFITPKGIDYFSTRVPDTVRARAA